MVPFFTDKTVKLPYMYAGILAENIGEKNGQDSGHWKVWPTFLKIFQPCCAVCKFEIHVEIATYIMQWIPLENMFPFQKVPNKLFFA